MLEAIHSFAKNSYASLTHLDFAVSRQDTAANET
jgi:hypothetical protein